MEIPWPSLSLLLGLLLPSSLSITSEGFNGGYHSHKGTSRLFLIYFRLLLLSEASFYRLDTRRCSGLASDTVGLIYPYTPIFFAGKCNFHSVTFIFSSGCFPRISAVSDFVDANEAAAEFICACCWQTGGTGGALGSGQSGYCSILPWIWHCLRSGADRGNGHCWRLKMMAMRSWLLT